MKNSDTCYFGLFKLQQLPCNVRLPITFAIEYIAYTNNFREQVEKIIALTCDLFILVTCHMCIQMSSIRKYTCSLTLYGYL